MLYALVRYMLLNLNTSLFSNKMLISSRFEFLKSLSEFIANGEDPQKQSDLDLHCLSRPL